MGSEQPRTGQVSVWVQADPTMVRAPLPCSICRLLDFHSSVIPIEKAGTCSVTTPLLKTCIPTMRVHTPISLAQAACSTWNTLFTSHLLLPMTPTWPVPIPFSRLCTRLSFLRNVSKAKEHSKRSKCKHHSLSQ